MSHNETDRFLSNSWPSVWLDDGHELDRYH